jgi:hypothetical protein
LRHAERLQHYVDNPVAGNERAKIRSCLVVSVVERAGAEPSADARRVLRQEQSLPLLATIAAERDQLARTVLPKSPLGDAVRYLTNQWTALQRFVEDGRLAIDNNRADAASGIRARMPPARLCREMRRGGRIRLIATRTTAADAA